ncbi:hypothetical protein DPMN_007347 [Dreissena polymorpha]|uniref:Uncharacterized protein n=1 Tax=Dreissena polymorpha TaxID=45954 RepID=A0A9D4MYB4_DREPO|nr:hypothetical protein DPMN_007347 [Dreissena polymorpha]
MSVVETQPNSKTTEADQISYVDSDTHAREYCCCLHGWGTGPDPRWYYPWDKGIYRMFGVCCMWYCVCFAAPCVLCKKEFRDIIFCADQMGNRPEVRHRDASDEIAEA